MRELCKSSDEIKRKEAEPPTRSALESRPGRGPHQLGKSGISNTTLGERIYKRYLAPILFRKGGVDDAA